MGIDVAQTLSTVRSAHHTNKYKTNALVVRRGFPVRVATTSTRLSVQLVPIRSGRRLDRRYYANVSTSFSTGRENEWSLQSTDEPDQVDLIVPVSAKVGLYLLRDEDDGSDPVPLVVLFNPYSSEDSVYMSNNRELREYLQNENGRVWRGSYNSFSGMPWVYSQFNVQVLVAALDLLDRIPVSDRDDPVQVSRALSALINSSDRDNGVIVGNWSGDYEDGVSPSAWTGSLDILKRYWESGSRPVSYGQCWVFAGVFASVMRTIGIPCQVISNFSSAHERKPYNRVIEHFYDQNGEPIPDRNMGSTWNFHVWNMAWMKRPDLAQAASDHGLDYDGWQVVDGTPQEQSEGIYRVGPCPVEAIKHGYEVDFDADFVIGEVNADMAYYVQRGSRFNPRYEEFNRDRRIIGKYMSVKRVGRDSRQDVTSMYKFKEGSSEERESFLNRQKGTSISSRSFNPVADTPNGDEPGDAGENEKDNVVSFDVSCPTEVTIGQDISYGLNLKMEEVETDIQVTNVHVNIQIEGTDYTGQSMGIIKKISEEVDLSSAGESTVSAEVVGEEYESLLRKGVQTIHFDTAVIVHGENGSSPDDDVVQIWSSESLVRINVDDMLTARFSDEITLKPDEDETEVAYVPIDEEFTVTATINNISHTVLTGVVLRVEGDGIKQLEEISLDDLQIDETREVEIICKGTKRGDRLLVMTLDTVEIMDIARSVHVLVQVEGDEDASALDDEEEGWEGEEAESVEGIVDLGSLEVITTEEE